MKKTAYTETYDNGVTALIVRGVVVKDNLNRGDRTLSDPAYLERMAEKINAACDTPFPDPVKEIPPVDRANKTLVDGSPVTEDHREINPKTGMQKDYVVLSEEERAKGFVRPVRTTYIHISCGKETKMALPLAETYARDPKFYSGTFCVHCGVHRPVIEFRWAGTTETVGS